MTNNSLGDPLLIELPQEFFHVSNYIEERATIINKEYYNKMKTISNYILSKNIQDNKNDEITSKFVNIPLYYIIKIYVQNAAMYFPELQKEIQTFNKEGIIEVQSQTLKRWKERFLFFNYYSKRLTILKDKNKIFKNIKYSINLNDYVIRWIFEKHNKKYFFSLNSINYKNRYKNFIFSSKNYENLIDWYENLRLTIANEKIIDLSYSLELTSESFLQNNPEIYMKQKRIHSRSALTQKKNINEFSKDKINNYKESNKLNKSLVNNSESYYPANFYSLNEDFNEKLEFRIGKEFKLNKMFNEINYELKKSNQNVRILQKIDNSNKFKIKIKIPFYFESIIKMFIDQNIIKKWNKNIEEYKILNVISNEIRIIYEKLKKYGFFYFSRSFYLLERIYNLNDITLICYKSINSNDPIENFSIKGKILKKYIAIKKIEITEKVFHSEICIFLHIENNGFLTKNQDNQLIHNYLESYLEILDFLRTRFILESNKTTSENLRILYKNNKIVSDFIKYDIQNESRKRNSLTFPRKKDSTTLEKDLQGYIPKSSFQKELIQILSQITNNNHVLNIISFTKQLKKDINMYKSQSFNSNDEQNDYPFKKKLWKIQNNGIFIYNNPKQKAQNKYLHNLLITCSNSFNIQLMPLDSFDMCSELEKFACYFLYAPIIFKTINNLTSYIEQMKIAIIFFISVLRLSFSQKIPFCGFLGETYQGKIYETYIYLEKVCENPNKISFLLKDDNFTIYGFIQYNIYMNENKLILKNDGIINLELNNNKFIAYFPEIITEYINDDERLVYSEGKMIVIGIEQNLLCEIEFSPLKQSSKHYSISNFGKNSRKFNYFEGNIFQYNKNSFDYLLKNKNNLKNEKNKNEKNICKINGNIYDIIEFDQKQYWNFEKNDPAELEKDDYFLPSDCFYRKDIIKYKLGLLKEAEKEKEILAKKENYDQFLREINSKII